MKVVLIQDVAGLGIIGETKEVKNGYGMNYLLKKGMAVLPNDPKVGQIMSEKNEVISKQKKEKQDISIKLNELKGKTYTFTKKADKKGKLYGSIGPKELAKVTGLKENIFKKHYKEIGEYLEKITLDGQEVEIKIVVKNEK